LTFGLFLTALFAGREVNIEAFSIAHDSAGDREGLADLGGLDTFSKLQHVAQSTAQNKLMKLTASLALFKRNEILLIFTFWLDF